MIVNIIKIVVCSSSQLGYRTYESTARHEHAEICLWGRTTLPRPDLWFVPWIGLPQGKVSKVQWCSGRDTSEEQVHHAWTSSTNLFAFSYLRLIMHRLRSIYTGNSRYIFVAVSSALHNECWPILCSLLHFNCNHWSQQEPTYLRQSKYSFTLYSKGNKYQVLTICITLYKMYR